MDCIGKFKFNRTGRKFFLELFIPFRSKYRIDGVVKKNNVKNEAETTMNHLTRLLSKLQNAQRNQLSKGTARKRFGNRLYLERLEERALMALVAAWSAADMG